MESKAGIVEKVSRLAESLQSDRRTDKRDLAKEMDLAKCVPLDPCDELAGKKTRATRLALRGSRTGADLLRQAIRTQSERKAGQTPLAAHHFVRSPAKKTSNFLLI
jgi:hypothetical protein